MQDVQRHAALHLRVVKSSPWGELKAEAASMKQDVWSFGDLSVLQRWPTQSGTITMSCGTGTRCCRGACCMCHMSSWWETRRAGAGACCSTAGCPGTTVCWSSTRRSGTSRLPASARQEAAPLAPSPWDGNMHAKGHGLQLRVCALGVLETDNVVDSLKKRASAGPP